MTTPASQHLPATADSGTWSEHVPRPEPAHPAGAGGGPVPCARLGGIRLLRPIGSGGMGDVYLGHHETLDIDVAVKVMRQGMADAARFLAEARLAARVQHAHIVRTLHAGEDEGRLYLVMELVTGGNLKQALAETGRMPWRRAAELALQAARGLAAAHRAGVVHRDVKPSNLLLTASGEIKVADLGLARDVLGGGDGHTHTGNVLGTPAYMAPEQVRDSRTAGPAADVYALGVTLFQLLANEVPFRRSSDTNVLFAHVHDAPPDVRSVNAEVPPALARLVARMLAKDPAERPSHGDDLAQSLERVLGLATGSTAAMGADGAARSRPSATGLWKLPAVAAMVIAGVLFIDRVQRQAPAGPPPAELPDPVLARAAVMAPVVDAPPAAPAAVPPAPERPVPIQVPIPAPGPVPAAAVAPLVAVVEPPADPAPVAPLDAWQTPPRAVFLVGDGIAPATRAVITTALLASGLRVVERHHIDRLIAEQRLVGDGRADPATAVALGRLVGGHIALFAAPAAGQVELRAVVVESGEIAASQLAAEDQAGTAAASALAAALRLLPAQGWLAGEPPTLSLGARHGIRVGDVLQVGVTAADGARTALGTATVTAVEPGTARVAITAVQPVPAGAWARSGAR